MKKATFTALFCLSQVSRAEVMPTPDKTVHRMLPDDPEFKNDTIYKRRFEEVVKTLTRDAETARSTLRAGQGDPLAPPSVPSNGPNFGAHPQDEPLADPRSDVPQTSPQATAPSPSITEDEAPAPVEFAPVKAEMLRKLPRRKPTRDASITGSSAAIAPVLPLSGGPAFMDSEATPATTTLVYGVSHPEAYDETMTVLPAGSFVKARIVSGVEANTLEPYPVLLQLEYAFTGPNKTKVDLSNCFMIAKARANLSTERVIMETDTLSCVRESGEHFKSNAKGYTAGEDSTFGSTGVFISKQGQVMLAAVLASIAKNAGEAVATAQQTTTVAGFDRAQTATNVTGNKAAFIAGRATIDGAAMIAQWYLDYAKQLVPSIGIGSGQTVHVVMLETIRVPTLAE